jgi:localization factor PodJL
VADSNLPWSIKGISAEAREAAREAAKRAGLPLGAWLARTIREVAAAEAREREEPEGATPKS